MSKSNIPTPIPVADSAEVEETVDPKQPNILVRGYRKARKNPKTVIAVVAVGALTLGAAALGRSTAPANDSSDPDVADDVLELEITDTDSVA